MGKYREPERTLSTDEIDEWKTQFPPHLVKSAFFTEALRRALSSVNGEHQENGKLHQDAVIDQTLININEYQ